MTHHELCQSRIGERCTCALIARLEAHLADTERRHWPSYAAGMRDAATLPWPALPADVCARCLGAGRTWHSSSLDPADVSPEPCEDCT